MSHLDHYICQMSKKIFQSTIENMDSSVYYFHVTVPPKIAKQFITKESKRVVCTLNNSISFQAAILSKGDGGYFIQINKENRKKLKLNVGDKVEVSIEKDESKYGLPMPEEMEELLLMDPEGDAVFHSLTPGKQRSLLFIIGKPKNSDTRLKKAVVVVDYLKMTGGTLDFKELNEAFKQANSR